MSMEIPRSIERGEEKEVSPETERQRREEEAVMAALYGVKPGDESYNLMIELRELRKKEAKTVNPADFTTEELKRRVALEKMETYLKTAPLSPEEEKELRELQIDQSKSTDWTPERANRFLYLTRRGKAAKKIK